MKDEKEIHDLSVLYFPSASLLRNVPRGTLPRFTLGRTIRKGQEGGKENDQGMSRFFSSLILHPSSLLPIPF